MNYVFVIYYKGNECKSAKDKEKKVKQPPENEEISKKKRVTAKNILRKNSQGTLQQVKKT